LKIRGIPGGKKASVGVSRTKMKGDSGTVGRNKTRQRKGRETGRGKESIKTGESTKQTHETGTTGEGRKKKEKSWANGRAKGLWW